MLKVAIAENHTFMRFLMRNFFEFTMGWSIILETSNGMDCIQQLSELNHYPDILFMDVAMPIMDGREATSIISQLFSSIKIIGLSSLFHEHVIHEMIQNGAKGFISKTARQETFTDCVNSVMDNQRYIEGVSQTDIEEYLSMSAIALTTKQKRFLGLCATEKGYKEIAAELNITYSTVDSYRAELCRKLNVGTRQGLAIYAIKTGLAIL